MNGLEVILVAINQLIAQLVLVLPKLIIALLIWYVGKYLINLFISLLKKIDIKSTELDKKAVETLSVVVNGVGRVILILVILDYLGIGNSVISAIAQGVTYAIAIALGISFGKALEPEAKKFVDGIKTFLHK